MFILHENETMFIASLNGEQLKLLPRSDAVTHVLRWTASGWKSFVTLPGLNQRAAREMAVKLLLQLTGDTAPEPHDKSEAEERREPEKILELYPRRR